MKLFVLIPVQIKKVSGAANLMSSNLEIFMLPRFWMGRGAISPSSQPSL